MSDSLQPHGLQLTRLLRPWDFPGKAIILQFKKSNSRAGSCQSLPAEEGKMVRRDKGKARETGKEGGREELFIKCLTYI